MVIPQKSSHCSPLQRALTWQFFSGCNSSKVLPLQPTLTWQFLSGGNSSKVLPLQPIAAHFYMAIFNRGDLSLTNLPIAAHCSALLQGNFSQGVIPQKSSHCSPLLHGNFRQVVTPQKSSHCRPLQRALTWQFLTGGIYPSQIFPLQPIAARSYMAILVRV